MSSARLTLSETWLENLPSAEVRALDPRRHTLIEASAGTGKTFAVEHLVLRLLMENPDWVPEEILLLSFTEKTAADLRARIRALLHRQVRKPGPQEGPDKAPILGWSEDDKKRLHMLWTHADDLAVHTLHGFCQSSLRRDPLTSNVLIRDEVADDRAAADDALENLLRGPWAKDPVRLAKLRDALDIGGGEDWRRKLVRLALAWHPWRGDRLDPERDPGTLESLEQGATEATLNLFAAVEAVEKGSYTVFDFRRSFKTTKTAQTELSRHAYYKVFDFVQTTLSGGRGAAAKGATDSAKAALSFFRKNFKKNSVVLKRGWESEIPAAAVGLTEWRQLAAASEVLRNLDAQLEDARRLQKLGLRAEAAMELRAELGREKIRRGVISYDDMPANLVKALRKNPELATRIRRRYKACIVDEFQDTDPVQWEILEALCLPQTGAENSGGRLETQQVLPLFLVGDPKQAIYGFRGGDLRTYLAARSLFRDMAAAGRAQGFGLEANFRSRRTLIEALNATFAHADWFGAPAETPPDPAWRLPAESEHVAFTPARAGGADESVPVPRVTLRDFAGMEGLVPGKPPKKSEVERAIRRWIVARIVAAVKAGRPPGEIAILVRRNNEGEAMERLLRRCGIPCRVRRRGGVFGGPTADALRLLLEWIDDAANPDAQARILLLPFARESAEDLPRGRPLECPPLIARWALLAKAGRWPEFFDSVRRESGYHDRLVALSPSEAERFERLSRTLAEAGSIPGTSVHALCEQFDNFRRGEGSGENGVESAGEGEDAVTIMTLHMSKGLEFPVVFLNAAGESVRSSHYVLRPRGEPGFRIALDTKDPEATAEHEEQERGEEQRLFYVAFTRAKDELHLPLLPAEFARGKSGPLGGFAAEALRAAALSPETSALFQWDADPLPAMLEDQTGAEAVIDFTESRDGEEIADSPDRNGLLAASREAFGRRRKLTSYSALALRGKTETPKWTSDWIDEDGTRILREEPSLTSPEDAPEVTLSSEHKSITATELPAGAAAGTALHAILEHTVFASAAGTSDPTAWLDLPGNRERVEEALRRESVDPACAPAAARAVWNTLRMLLPDPAGGPSFRLADLPQEDDYRHEVEFLLPFSSGSFLWGFIDLVFRYEGRYYLLDWKSNLLPAYDRDSVRRSMEAHQYDLQWRLYSVALDRWLKARLPGYDPATHFGGVHYLYLRGSAPTHFSGFSDRPTLQQLREEFPAEIARLLGAEIATEILGAR